MANAYRNIDGSLHKNRKHGMKGTKVWNTWSRIRGRCFNTKGKDFPKYGGREITVCTHWLTFKNFFADMGEPPSPKHSIERKDNNGNYSCGHCSQCLENDWTANCVWATNTEQANNRRSSHYITYQGKTQTVAMWSKDFHIPYNTLLNRIQNNWDLGLAMATPAQTNHKNRRYYRTLLKQQP